MVRSGQVSLAPLSACPLQLPVHHKYNTGFPLKSNPVVRFQYEISVGLKLKTTAHKSWSVGFSIDVVSSVAAGRADSTLSNRCVCYCRPSSNGSLLVFASTARHSLPPSLAAREGLGWSVVGGANRSEALGEATLRGPKTCSPSSSGCVVLRRLAFGRVVDLTHAFATPSPESYGLRR